MHRPSGDNDSSNYDGYDGNNKRIKYHAYRARLIYEERIIASTFSEIGISFQLYESRRIQEYPRHDSVRCTDVLSFVFFLFEFCLLAYQYCRNNNLAMIFFYCFINLRPRCRHFFFVDSSTVSRTLFSFASYSRLINHASLSFDKPRICRISD